MSRLLNYKKTASSSLHEPEWITNATVLQRRLYLEAKKQFEAKKAEILAGKASDGKCRKIVASQVALAAGCDKSNISERKNPDLHKWIKDRTEELIALAQEKLRSRASRKKTAEEVRKENALIRHQIMEYRNHDYAKIAEALLSSTLTESHKNISAELAELRRENQTLQNQVAELRETNKQLIKSINISPQKHN
ncbi:hypothetical protein LY624_10465 [Pseudoalteromonas sp. N1230-9]|uniref:hypothetical protein n=1 Tax=Pseudoalteromonas sp. N1230-9 TaxID=2907156 RepID=UPI002B318452|nr:hypothetical protein LY624_10465 [Pseudoalteromonas sp. N1230-9]